MFPAGRIYKKGKSVNQHAGVTMVVTKRGSGYVYTPSPATPSRLSPSDSTQHGTGVSDSKALNPFSGIVAGNYWTQTGMPWVSSEGRKAVLTEWFWQPIRGQPRRVDTNELRRFAQTTWVYNCVNTIISEISSLGWEIIPKDEISYDEFSDQIDIVHSFFDHPNSNNEPLNELLRAWLKDILEIDAGVIVKVYSKESYDFEHLEPKSGAPLLKPLLCPYCNASQRMPLREAQEKQNRLKRALLENKVAHMRKSESMRTSLERVELIRKFSETSGVNIVEDAFVNPFIYDRLDEFVSLEKDLDLQMTVLKEAEEIIHKRLHDEFHPKGLSKKAKSEFVQKAFDFAMNSTTVACPFCNGTGRGRMMTEIFVRDGASFLVEVDKFGAIKGWWQYSYQIPAHPMWFNREEISYTKMMPRGSSPYGFSPVQAALDLIKQLDYSQQYNKKIFENQGVPDGIITVPDASEADMRRFNEMWNQEMIGRPHKLATWNSEINFVPFMRNNREMEFLKSQQWLFKLIISAFNLTPAELGFTEDVNKATSATQADIARRKGIRPLLNLLEEKLTRDIIHELGYMDVKFRFTVRDLTEEEVESEINERNLRNGLTTINEIRIRKGEEPVPWGEGFNPFGLMIADNPFNQAEQAVMGTNPAGKPSQSPHSGESKDDEPENSPKPKGEEKKKSIELKDIPVDQVHACYFQGKGPCVYLTYGMGGAKCQYVGFGAVKGSIPEGCPLGFEADRDTTENKPSPNQLYDSEGVPANSSEWPSSQHVSVQPRKVDFQPNEYKSAKGPTTTDPDMRGQTTNPLPKVDQEYQRYVEQNPMIRNRNADNLETAYPFAETKYRCPECGGNKLVQYVPSGVNDPHGNDTWYRCLNHDGLYTEAQLRALQAGGVADERVVVQDGIPEQHSILNPDYSPSAGQLVLDKPVTKPTWSPKGVNRNVKHRTHRQGRKQGR